MLLRGLSFTLSTGLGGYPKPIPDNPSKARARATLLMQLNEFKKVVRGVVMGECLATLVGIK